MLRNLTLVHVWIALSVLYLCIYSTLLHLHTFHILHSDLRLTIMTEAVLLLDIHG